MNLEIERIRLDGGTQAREMLNKVTVEEYQAAIRENADWPFPDVVCFYDGTSYWLADGFHRMRAAIRQNVVCVGVEVHQGSARDAVLYAVGANAVHGLRRTRGDRQRAVVRLLEDAEWGRWSDREIARRCNVSHTMVSKMRVIVTGKVASEGDERVFVNKHGSVSTMKTAAIGKAKKETQTAVPPWRVLEKDAGSVIRRKLSLYAYGVLDDDYQLVIRTLANENDSRHWDVMDSARDAMGCTALSIWTQAGILANNLPQEAQETTGSDETTPGDNPELTAAQEEEEEEEVAEIESPDLVMVLDYLHSSLVIVNDVIDAFDAFDPTVRVICSTLVGVKAALVRALDGLEE